MVTYSTSEFDEWLGSKRHEVSRQNISHRALEYFIRVTFVVGDLYTVGGIELDILRGTAKTVTAVIVNKRGGEGIMSYNYTSGKFQLYNGAGVEIAANTPVGPATATIHVLARQ